MKKVMKYDLKPVNRQDLKLPLGAQVIAADCQYGNPVVWAVVDDNQKQEESQSFLLMQSGIPTNYPPEQFYRMRHLVTYQDNAFGKSFSLFLEALPAPIATVAMGAPKQSNAGPLE